MKKDINRLADIAMSNLMRRVCKDNVYKDMAFFSQKEFEEHRAEIFEITGLQRKLNKQLKDLDNGK